ncbi:hypothetical protein [Tunturiibacter psychrotolerans]|uniref:hypothetical protein n=1 Tax=Tunturiibacter psychrotolerans TaxID=3069686 RepID=UPI003D1D7320
MTDQSNGEVGDGSQSLQELAPRLLHPALDQWILGSLEDLLLEAMSSNREVEGSEPIMHIESGDGCGILLNNNVFSSLRPSQIGNVKATHLRRKESGLDIYVNH